MQKSNISNKEIKKIIIKSFLFIIPFSVLFIFYFNFRFFEKVSNEIKILEKEAENNSIKIELMFNYIENEIGEDLNIIKKSNEMNNYINFNNAYNEEELVNLFLRLASSKPNFDQIRFIDQYGYEKVRVNNTKKDCEAVSSDKLQYKGDRYYFIETKKLKNGEIYFSPLDLNIEHNEIEIPYKAVFRISTPIYKENKFLGIIIINYLASDLLDIIRETAKISKFESYLVNNEGYFLYNKETEKTFSFMFDDVDYNINEDIPNFNSIKNSNNTILFEDSIISINQVSKKEFSNFLKLFYVQTYNIKNFELYDNIFILNLSYLEFFILIIINLSYILISLFIYSKNKDKEQLKITSLISDNTNDAVIITDNKTNIILVNKTFEKITGYSQREITDKKTNYFKSGLHDEEYYKKMWESINKNKYWTGELWDKKKNGLLYPKLLKIYAIEKKYTKSIEKYVGIFSDLTKEKENENEIKRLHEYNYETNLPNKKLLYKLLDDAIKNNNIFGILCFSISNYSEVILKKTNDEIYSIFSSFINKIQKYFYHDTFLAQISSDTFVIVILGFKEKEEIKNFIIKLIDNLTSIDFYLDFNTVAFNIKSGAAIYPFDGKNSADLLNNSKIALESANHKNEALIFSSDKIKDSIQKQYLMNFHLKNALENNELYLNYQPQIDSINKKIIGVEALIRWENPSLGFISPFFFIPIAEKNGYIIKIGYWIIEKVFIDYNNIKSILPKNFKISINISTLQFNDNNLIKKIIELSQKHNVNLSNFELEITESVVAADIKLVNNKIKAFKNLGLSVSMDDFGTGFSSLSYLKNLIIDKIKIDRAFIKDYPENDNGAVANIIVKISKELNLDLITEGVETKEQLEFINSIGCKNIQGYYFSKPLLLNQLKEYIINFK